MDIQLDEGYMYGMWLFETIAIYQGKCVLLNMHLERLNKGLRALNIPKQIYKEQIALYLQTADSSHDVLKIMVSEKNTIFSTRKNLYTKKKQAEWLDTRFQLYSKKHNFTVYLFQIFSLRRQFIRKKTGR